jgi:hypothetical protein
MESPPHCPNNGVELGSSVRNTPDRQNGGLPPSSDYPNPPSPSSRTPTQTQFDSSLRTNWFENQNKENPFIRGTTPDHYSATPHRLPTKRTKRTNPSQTILPASKYAKMNEPSDADDALVQSRMLLVKAIEMEDNQPRKLSLMDLLNVFRDFTEGQPVDNAVKTIGNSVSHLESIARKLTKASNQATARAITSTPSQEEQPRQPGLASSLFNNLANKTQDIFSTLKPSAKQAREDRNKTKKERRLILIKPNQEAYALLHSLQLRNQINEAFKLQHQAGPVVSTITKSLTQNLVITTTSDFNAKYLLQHQDTWRSLIAYKEAKEDIQYFKVIIHGIPLRDFSYDGYLETIKDEINTFNKELELKIIGIPYWLTSETKRADPNQYKASIVVTFEKEEQAQRAIRQRLMVAGFSARVEKLYSTAPSTQCTKCCGYGHLHYYCKKDPVCMLCAGNHATPQHHCETCQITGKACPHTKFSCTLCSEEHPSNSKDCALKPTNSHHA